jgi:asparagine synthase (glutamine-hydrolysing)
VCGIAGGTGRNSQERSRILDRQLTTLRHRGPDSWGFLPGGSGAVGQTRLSVIDLLRSDPPLTDESGAVRVALNGEIYNFKELRRELLEEGHQLASEGDTEVIAHLAEDHSPVDLCRRLDGMFAFGVWDERDARLVLGRDRFGKKPLYYWYGQDELVFGSEIKAVLADPRVPRRLNTNVVPQYLSFGYAPTPETFFEGVRSLPAGHVLTFVRGGPPVIERYWSVPVVPQESLLRWSLDDAARHLRELLRAAVARRLVADVPLGAFLSGGVDSSAVVGLMAEQMTEPVRTFSIGFQEKEFDEREWGALVARRFGTRHSEHIVTADAAHVVDRILDACDQPFADSSALPTFFLSEVTRRDVTVALSGDGGDEVFAGYDRFAAALLLRRAPRALRGLSVAAAGIPRLSTRIQRLLEAGGTGMPEAYERLVMISAPEDVRRLLGGDAAARVTTTHSDLWASSAGASALHRLLHLNINSYLLDDLLVKVDRMSMQHGLEVRSPLLDPALLDFAMSVTPDLHVRGLRLKRLLKAAVADLVPVEVLNRPKKGFGVPVARWLRNELRPLVEGELLAPSARLAALVNAQEVQRLAHEHEIGRRDHGQRLWALLLLERFLRREGW